MQTVGEIVAKDVRAALVFKQYGIDFYLEGNKALNTLCLEHEVDVSMVVQDLGETLNHNAHCQPHYNMWKAGFLCDYIQHEHHHFTKQVLHEVVKLSDELLQKSCKQLSGTQDLHAMLLDVQHEMQKHIAVEEQTIFRYIKQIERSPTTRVPFSVLENPISQLRNQHLTLREMFKELEKMSHEQLKVNYMDIPPTLHKRIEELTSDFYIHIHLENNVLYPKALALESE